MIKKISIFIFLFSFLNGSNIIINSKFFKYNQNKNISIFTKDVNVTKQLDNILCDKLVVYFDKNKKLSKMVAFDNVRFVVNDKNSTYKGKSDKLTYIAPKQLFIFEGHVHITKIQDNQQLFGNKVIIDKKNGTANVQGQKNKPLKFIIKVNN